MLLCKVLGRNMYINSAFKMNRFFSAFYYITLRMALNLSVAVYIKCVKKTDIK